MGRGAVAWAGGGAATGSGPAFFVALAAMPQLGVSHTVWAHVVEADVQRLGDFARAFAAARPGRDADIPFTIEWLKT